MKRAVLSFLWISVIVTGVFLRFEHLDKRPFHADEATGARITARRMESGANQFDPQHFHGPMLADLTIPLCKLRAETRWQEMTKATLRTLPAMAGALLVLLPLFWRRRYGDAAMGLAAAILATSPLLVYYSRMFIHESLLVLFGMLALMSLTRNPRWGIPGLLIGLMFATKESFAISLIAWSGAGLLIALESRKWPERAIWVSAWHLYRWPVGLCLLAATVTAAGIYTDGFQHPQGAFDALRTFFVYKTGVGHDKSIGYYAKLLALPQKSGGVWWFGTPAVGLAIFAYLNTFRRDPAATPGRSLIRFLAYAAVGHVVIYSLIAYKTPWLACLPWAHVCLLAGFALTGFRHHGRPIQIALVVLATGCLVTQFQQARRATGRYASDERNPYAYVPTRNDIETLEPWLWKLRQVAPGGSLEPVGVVGTDYWPLPWYLRSFDRVGYWPTPGDDLTQFPLVFALPESAAAVVKSLEKSHVAVLKGLRAEVPVYVFVRADIWKRWMETDRQ